MANAAALGGRARENGEWHLAPAPRRTRAVDRRSHPRGMTARPRPRAPPTNGSPSRIRLCCTRSSNRSDSARTDGIEPLPPAPAFTHRSVMSSAALVGLPFVVPQALVEALEHAYAEPRGRITTSGTCTRCSGTIGRCPRGRSRARSPPRFCFTMRFTSPAAPDNEARSAELARRSCSPSMCRASIANASLR